ncbi:MAG: histidinol dehydrogenase [Lentimonas sp.]|jgi:histidinol dehydrogenase
MKKFANPTKEVVVEIQKRQALDYSELLPKVQNVFKAVQEEGDTAILRFTEQFDRVKLQKSGVDSDELEGDNLSSELKNAIDVAYDNIYAFHLAQDKKETLVETTEGVKCWRENRAIEKVGFYIPGGSAPLFSTVLMLGIPAKIAKCDEIVLCTPPNKEGQIHPAILYAAKKCGIKSIYKIGGIQAIAAMTLGTESVSKVFKIFGPGNAFVTAAKQYAQSLGVSIDMPAGPSEVLVIADANANPSYVAADLLSQAEHGPDSQVILLSDSQKAIDNALLELESQLAALPRKDIATQALQNSSAVLLTDLEACLDFSNEYAPEHLILALDDSERFLPNIKNAGSVFIGEYSCESLGDYASGTNHTLPTNGFARSYSGVSLDSFIKKITFQSVSKKGILNIGPAVEIMAEAEGLFAHKNAVSVRLKNIEA